MTKKVISNVGSCIYCGEEKPFSSEHYLPECLAKFKGMETLDDRICRECNNQIGREVEDQFCRAGEVGFLRYGLGIEGKKRREEVNPFRRGSSGSSPLKMKGKIPGTDEEVHLQLVKGSRDGRTVSVDYLSQLILTSESGEIHHLLLTGITDADQLKKRIEERGIDINKLKTVNVVATEAEQQTVEKLTAIWPSVQEAKWETLPMLGKTFTNTEYEVTDKYFRAIAKIGFHYVLKHFRHFRGDEDGFAGIRDFIMNGGPIADYVTWSQKQVIAQVSAGCTPTTFSHVVLGRANQHLVWSQLQFFLGPDTVPLVYTVKLADNKPTLIYDITSGHSFVYYDGGPKDGVSGQMDNLVWIYKSPSKK
jgi:hypothetical protein